MYTINILPRQLGKNKAARHVGESLVEYRIVPYTHKDNAFEKQRAFRIAVVSKQQPYDDNTKVTDTVLDVSPFIFKFYFAATCA